MTDIGSGVCIYSIPLFSYFTYTCPSSNTSMAFILSFYTAIYYLKCIIVYLVIPMIFHIRTTTYEHE